MVEWQAVNVPYYNILVRILGPEIINGDEKVRCVAVGVRESRAPLGEIKTGPDNASLPSTPW